CAMYFSSTSWVICFCFFFQAEDGIRDGHVTGVQTCALPISPANLVERVAQDWLEANREGRPVKYPDLEHQVAAGCSFGEAILTRSEERRVGKECRCRW